MQTSYGFIYVIENVVNGKLYVGQTVDLYKREINHLSGFSRCPALNNAIAKYGRNNFEFVIIEGYASREELNIAEQRWIKELNSLAPGGYNLREGGNAGGLPSEETCVKISENRKGKNKGMEHYLFGKKMPQETKDKVSQSRKGKNVGVAHPRFGKTFVMLEDTKNKISEANKGKKQTEETRKRISESKKGSNHPYYGKSLPESTRNKISASLTGRPCWCVGLPKELHPRFGKKHSAETKENISNSITVEERERRSLAKMGDKNPMFGKKISEETRAKRSASLKNSWARRKAINGA